jgi:hypothetical protein
VHPRSPGVPVFIRFNPDSFICMGRNGGDIFGMDA